MTKPIILSLVGMPGAGKSQAAKFFRKLNLPVIQFGEVTKKGIEESGLRQSETNERIFRETLRNKLGMAAYAIKIEPLIRKSAQKNSLLILDGLRSFEEYLFLRRKGYNVKIICIYARPEIRHERLLNRIGRKLTLKESQKRDLAEVGNLDMGRPIALADYMIENDESIEKLNYKLEALLTQIRP